MRDHRSCRSREGGLRGPAPLLLALMLFAAVPGVARGGDEDAWPAKGPVREGPSLGFPTIGVRWSLPEGSPFAWTSPTHDEMAAGKGAVRVIVRVAAS